jgi:hypothetical protein
VLLRNVFCSPVTIAHCLLLSYNFSEVSDQADSSHKATIQRTFENLCPSAGGTFPSAAAAFRWQKRPTIEERETYGLLRIGAHGAGGTFPVVCVCVLCVCVLCVFVCVYIPTGPGPPSPQPRLRPLAMGAYGGPAQTKQVSTETYYRGKRDLLYADF